MKPQDTTLRHVWLTTRKRCFKKPNTQLQAGHGCALMSGLLPGADGFAKYEGICQRGTSNSRLAMVDDCGFALARTRIRWFFICLARASVKPVPIPVAQYQVCDWILSHANLEQMPNPLMNSKRMDLPARC